MEAVASSADTERELRLEIASLFSGRPGLQICTNWAANARLRGEPVQPDPDSSKKA